MTNELKRRAQVKVTDKFLLDLFMLPADMKILDCSIKEDGIIRLVVEHNSFPEIDPVWDKLPVITCDVAKVTPDPYIKFDWNVEEGEGG